MKNRISMEEHWLGTTYSIPQGELYRMSEVQIEGERYSAFSEMIHEQVENDGRVHSAWVKHFFVRVSLFGKTFELDLKMILGKVAVYATEFELTTVEE